MAVTRITSGKSIRTAVDYATQGSAHKSNKYIGNKRDLYDTAVNGAVDPKLFIKETEYQLRHDNRYHDGQKQEVRTIISFDPKQLNVKDPNAPIKAGMLSRKIAKSIYPHNASHITIQADGEGKNRYHLPIIHAHIITCARRLDNGKSITHDATFRKIQPKVDKVIHDNGFKLPPDPYRTIERTVNGRTKKIKVLKGSKRDNSIIERKTNERLEKKGSHSWMHNLADILNSYKKSATSWNQLIHGAYVDGVTVNPFRMKRVKGSKHHGRYKYKFHVYRSNKTKSGKPRKGSYIKIGIGLTTILSHVGLQDLVKNANLAKHKGEYLRLSRQIKYTYQGKTVRDKKLGSDFNSTNLDRSFTKNAQHDHELETEMNKIDQMNKVLAKSNQAKAKNDPYAKVKALIKDANYHISHHLTPPALKAIARYNKNKNKIHLSSLNVSNTKHKVPQHHYDPEIRPNPPELKPEKPKLITVYHAKPSSAPVKNALNRVQSLTQRISASKGKTKADLIMQKRDAMDKFDDQAREFLDKMQQSQTEFEDAREYNRNNIAEYRQSLKTYYIDQATKDRANQVRYRGRGFDGPEFS